MQNSQDSSLSSNPTVAKLLEVDADLAAQEVDLMAQLQSIREKRHSLKTVVDLFAPVDTVVDSMATPVQTPIATLATESAEVEAASTDLDTTVPELDDAKIDTPQKQQAKKNSSPPSSQQSQKSAPAQKVAKELESWQQYVKEDFGNASLAEAVSEVMQQQPEQVLEIATILGTIFVDKIPPKVRSTARERISNVLSVGAKKGRWYRGQTGRYSMSKAAVKNDSLT